MTHHGPSLQSDSLYNELAKACRAKSYANVLKISAKILVSVPTDAYAVKCRIVALIHSERYSECLDFIKKKKINDCVLEKAYCEYRLNHLYEALKTIEISGKESSGLLELKAQIFYRLEEFEKSHDCYKVLTKSYSDDYEDERFTNFLASKAALSMFKAKIVPLDYTQAVFETDFNVACYYIGQNSYSQAMKYLDSAEKLCRQSFDDDPDASDDLINQELASISIQRAYILQKQRKEVAASKIYHTLMRDRSGDPSLLAVAANNLICINREQNVFDTKKRIKAASIDGLEFKLFRSQRMSMLFNQGLFCLHTNQLDTCRAKVKAILAEDPNSLLGTILSAAHYIRNKQISSAITLLRNYLKSAPEGSGDKENPRQRLLVPLCLLHIHLLSLSKRSNINDFTAPLLPSSVVTWADGLHEAAVLADELIPKDLLQLPACVALRVALRLAGSRSIGTDSGDDESITAARNAATTVAKNAILDALASWDKEDISSPSYQQFVDRCVGFFMENGFAREAAVLLEKRIKDLKKSTADKQSSNESDAVVLLQKRQNLLALLIQAYSRFDPVKADAASAELEFKETLSEKAVDALETSFLVGVKNIKRAGRVVGTPATPKSETKVVACDAGQQQPLADAISKKKKKRKIRLPKNYEPGVPPDPERWLPRRERAGYRGKRRDRRGCNLLRGPQGQATAAPELDMGNKSPRDAPKTASPRSAPVETVRKPTPASKPHQKRKNKKR